MRQILSVEILHPWRTKDSKQFVEKIAKSDCRKVLANRLNRKITSKMADAGMDLKTNGNPS